MKKSEIFDVLIDKVCEVCEIRREAILGGTRLQSVVDARILVVQYLRRIGLSSDDIALIAMRKAAGDNGLCPPIEEVKRKAKNMDKLFNGYSARCLESYAFCLMSKEVYEFCAETYKDYYLSWMKELPK